METGGTLGGTEVIQLRKDANSIDSFDGELTPGVGTAGTLTITFSAVGELVLNSTPGQVNLVIPIPEPGTGLLLAIPALLLTLRLRRANQGQA